MKWQNRQRSRNIEDRRRVNNKVAAGGGLGFLGIALIVFLLGGDPSYFLQEGLTRTVQSSLQTEKIPPEAQKELVEFVSVVLAETESTWEREFARQGYSYQKPILVFFTNTVSSGCGYAQSAMGPFYCPLDKKIYIDLSFFYDLEKRHNAPGDFAQAYVVAHEVGHHVQNVLGILDKANSAKKGLNKKQANQVSIATELMADCMAGIWAQQVNQRGLLDDGDIQEALHTATQIGDDRLQKQTQGYIVPDSFTHGSGKQRYAAFKKGLESGQLQSCLNKQI